jgi:hypothetical protein
MMTQVTHQSRVEQLTRIADTERAQLQAARPRSQQVTASLIAATRTGTTLLRGWVTREPASANGRVPGAVPARRIRLEGVVAAARAPELSEAD